MSEDGVEVAYEPRSVKETLGEMKDIAEVVRKEVGLPGALRSALPAAVESVDVAPVGDDLTKPPTCTRSRTVRTP